MENNVLAELADVHKRYGNTVALDGLDLQIRQGELLSLLGPNGAGKTTAISLLLGLARPDRGRCTLFGGSPQTLEVRRSIGVMMQDVSLTPELRVREHIHLFSQYYPAPLAPEMVMELTHISSLAQRPYGKLSGGQKRQVQFAIALCGRPKLLFLDEPTVGLDIEARELMWGVLRRLVSGGTSIVLTTHYLEEAEALADRVAVVAKGRLVASGSVDEIRALIVRTRISCQSALSAEQVAQWPGVGSVSRQGKLLHLTATNAEAAVRQLLTADRDLQDLEVRRAGLADVFTELTKEAA